jgi:hypothetical protein
MPGEEAEVSYLDDYDYDSDSDFDPKDTGTLIISFVCVARY